MSDIGARLEDLQRGVGGDLTVLAELSDTCALLGLNATQPAHTASEEVPAELRQVLTGLETRVWAQVAHQAGQAHASSRDLHLATLSDDLARQFQQSPISSAAAALDWPTFHQRLATLEVVLEETTSLAWCVRLRHAISLNQLRAQNPGSPAVQPRAPRDSAPGKALAQRSLQLLTIEVGIELIPLLNERRGGDLVTQIQQFRRSLLDEKGWTVPPVHLRDNLQLDPGGYCILLREEPIARGILRADRWLARHPDPSIPALEGEPASDQWNKRSGSWIIPGAVVKAQQKGFKVRSPSTVLVEHLAEVVQWNAAEVYGAKNLCALLRDLRNTHPELMRGLYPGRVSFISLLVLLRNLIAEGVGLLEPSRIFEVLAAMADKATSPETLTTLVRQGLGDRLLANHLDKDKHLGLITLSEPLSTALEAAVGADANSASQIYISARASESLSARITRLTTEHQARPPVMLVPSSLRRPLQRLLARRRIDVPVLSPAEIPASVQRQVIAELPLSAIEVS